MIDRSIVYVVSHVEKSMALEWTAVRLAREYNLTFVLLNPKESPFESFLEQHHIQTKRFTLRSKVDFPIVFLRLFLLFLYQRPSVVHVHLFDAQRLALPAAWLAGIRRRIYTRHTSTLHHVYQPSGIKYDRWSNFFSTHVISISQATDHVLNVLEGVPADKILRVHHGFDWTEFNKVTPERIRLVRDKWKIPDRSPIVGVVSRFIEWKGVQFAIEGFANFLEKYPDACLVLANAGGPYEKVIAGRLEGMPQGTFVRIPFEEDVLALYRLFDLLVHVPVDPHLEAFGQVYVEAMASGVPCVITLSGIAPDFVRDHQQAMIVPYKDSGAIADSLTELWENKELRESIVSKARESVVSQFGIDRMITSLKHLYDG